MPSPTFKIEIERLFENERFEDIKILINNIHSTLMDIVDTDFNDDNEEEMYAILSTLDTFDFIRRLVMNRRINEMIEVINNSSIMSKIDFPIDKYYK